MAIRDFEYQPVGWVRGALRILGSALAAVLVVVLVSSVSLWIREPRTAVNEPTLKASA